MLGGGGVRKPPGSRPRPAKPPSEFGSGPRLHPSLHVKDALYVTAPTGFESYYSHLWRTFLVFFNTHFIYLALPALRLVVMTTQDAKHSLQETDLDLRAAHLFLHMLYATFLLNGDLQGK